MTKKGILLDNFSPEEIIVSHTHLDFDGLSSMVAASKLYPAAELVFSGNINENVREFILLYQDIINVHRSKEIETDKVKRVIMVDTSDIGRIGKFGLTAAKEDVEVIIYDHHFGDTGCKTGASVFMKKNGSNTTSLLELIIKNKHYIEISPEEATIFMLGIYEDTGSLSYTGTTSEDIRMAAYLLDKGADLEVVAKYITKTLSARQRGLFTKLLENGENITAAGEELFVSYVKEEHYTDGLDVVCNKIKDVENVDSVFIIAEFEKSCYIVGRSSSKLIDVSALLKKYNGKGHYNAGAAVLKDRNAEELYAELIGHILKNVKYDRTAENIMSSPVKTIEQDIHIFEAQRLMMRFGYGAFPIMNNGILSGIISRKDVDKACGHGYGNAPARAYMTSKIISANKNTTIDELRKLIIENEIGRIPILDENNILCGIVTRSDILRNTESGKAPKKDGYFEINISEQIEKAIDVRLYDIIMKIRELSSRKWVKVFMTGGIVRDIILGIKNYDFDIVVEGSGIEFAKELSDMVECEKIVIHDKFGTAVLVLANGMKIDIATSRVEYYEYPTSLPVVDEGTIKQDLFRRDFTINAMAVEIDSDGFGKLIDYFGGYRDLKEKRIKTLHNLSFIEDPTRIIRGVRFASRYGFYFDHDTERFIRDAVEKGVLERLSWKRVKTEFTLIFKEKNPVIAINMLFGYNVMRAIDSEIKLTPRMKKNLGFVEEILEKDIFREAQKWIAYFIILVDEIDKERKIGIYEKFNFTKEFTVSYNHDVKETKEVFRKLGTAENNSEIRGILSKYKIETLLVMYIKGGDAEKNKIEKYIREIEKVKHILTGKDLAGLGMKGSVEMGAVLKKVFVYQIDNNITEKKELINYAVKIMNSTIALQNNGSA